VSQELGGNFRQVALVFTGKNLMELYLDAKRIGSTPITAALSDIVDNNDWLGLSQYFTDNNYGGSYDEFRIYDHALSACEIEATYDAGPDAL
jgi:Concanavalin A-like lectin/glucanases superfamily